MMSHPSQRYMRSEGETDDDLFDTDHEAGVHLIARHRSQDPTEVSTRTRRPRREATDNTTVYKVVFGGIFVVFTLVAICVFGVMYFTRPTPSPLYHHQSPFGPQFRAPTGDVTDDFYPTLWVPTVDHRSISQTLHTIAASTSYIDKSKYNALASAAFPKTETAPEALQLHTSLTPSPSAIPMRRYVLIEFFAKWCGHCRRFAPQLERLGLAFNGEALSPVRVLKVHCAGSGSALCDAMNVRGYPSLMFADIETWDEVLNSVLPTHAAILTATAQGETGRDAVAQLVASDTAVGTVPVDLLKKVSKVPPPRTAEDVVEWVRTHLTAAARNDVTEGFSTLPALLPGALGSMGGVVGLRGVTVPFTPDLVSEAVYKTRITELAANAQPGTTSTTVTSTPAAKTTTAPAAATASASAKPSIPTPAPALVPATVAATTPSPTGGISAYAAGYPSHASPHDQQLYWAIALREAVPQCAAAMRGYNSLYQPQGHARYGEGPVWTRTATITAADWPSLPLFLRHAGADAAKIADARAGRAVTVSVAEVLRVVRQSARAPTGSVDADEVAAMTLPALLDELLLSSVSCYEALANAVHTQCRLATVPAARASFCSLFASLPALVPPPHVANVLDIAAPVAASIIRYQQSGRAHAGSAGGALPDYAALAGLTGAAPSLTHVVAGMGVVASRSDIATLPALPEPVWPSVPLVSAPAALSALIEAWQLSGQPWSHWDKSQWQQCRGSLSYTRGYTCALWSNIHANAAALVTDEARHGTLLRGARGEAPAAVAALALRTYLHHFFPCAECRTHFLSYSRALPTALTHTPDEDLRALAKSASPAVAARMLRPSGAFAVWLWTTHNSVNERLAKVEAESGMGDPVFPKMLFPTHTTCPSCRAEPCTAAPTAKIPSDGVVYKEDAAESVRGCAWTRDWVSDKIFAFLVDFYTGE